MDRKKLIYTIIVCVITFMTCVFAIGFAYIGKPTVVGNVNVNMNLITSGKVTFKYTGTRTMSLTVTEDALAGASSNTYTKYANTTNITSTLNLTTNATYFPNGVTCTYEIVYTPTVGYVETPAATTAGLRELALLGWIGSTKYFEVNIKGTSPIVLYTNTIATSSSATSKTQAWKFQGRFYNLNLDQTQAQGQNPTGVISVENGNCVGNSS